MTRFFWLAISFIFGGGIVLVSMKKRMEKRLALAIEMEEMGHEPISTTSIIYWIVGVTVWGVMSIFLVVSLFGLYF